MKFFNSYDEFVLLVFDGRDHLCHLSHLGETLACVADGGEVFAWFFDEDGHEVYSHPIRLVVHKNLDKNLDYDDEGDSEERDS